MSDPAMRPKQRTRTRITRAGALWLAATAVLWGTGLHKGINLLTLLAYWMFILGLLNLLVAGRQLRHLRLRRWAGDAVFAGTPFTVHVELANPDQTSHLGLRVEDRGSDHHFHWFVSGLQGRAKVRFREDLTVARRGWYAWEAPRLESGYPFGLLACGVAAADQPLLVYPALGRLNRGRLRQFLARSLPAPGRARLRPERHPAAQSEFHGLRDFRNGDSPRWIHWRTSARRGSLMVREFEDNPADDLVVVLEPWLPDPPSDGSSPAATETRSAHRRARQRLEAALSLATTVCWEWCRQKGDRLVLAVAGPAAPLVLDGVTGREHARLLLECLALLAGSSVIDPEPLLDRFAGMDLPTSPAMVISTRGSDLGDRLGQRLHRPVATVSVDEPNRYSFYEEPRPAPRRPPGPAPATARRTP